jgi:hypothetical protein
MAQDTPPPIIPIGDSIDEIEDDDDVPPPILPIGEQDTINASPVVDAPPPIVPLVPSHTKPPSLTEQILSTGKSFWNTINKPLVPMGEHGPMREARNLFREQHPTVGAGFDIGIDAASGLTSPLNIGTAIATEGGSLLGNRTMVRAGKLLSLPVMAEGGINLSHPDSSFAERLMGGLELLGGYKGARTKLPNKKISLPHELPVLPEEALIDPTGKPKVRSNGDGSWTEVNTNDIFHPEANIVIVSTTTRENVDKLAKLGYKPGGTLQEGPNKGKSYMVKGEPLVSPMSSHSIKRASLGRELYNLPRGMTTTLDLSAPMRQGLPLIASKAWWTSWNDMVRSFGSEDAFKAVQRSIEEDPSGLFEKKTKVEWGKDGPKQVDVPSIAQKAGLPLTDLDSWITREEGIQSQLPERMKFVGGFVRASNRAYTAYLNKLRADTFKNMYKDAQRVYDAAQVTGKSDGFFGTGIGSKTLSDAELLALKPERMATEIADYIGNATGRGKLATQGYGLHLKGEGETGKLPFKFTKQEMNLESHATGLTNVLFSPRLMASRVNMLNPLTYTRATPQVRRAYLKSALATAGAWMTAASLEKAAGADISLDPTNADFGKGKFGNLRIDNAGGFQQFIVAYSRMLIGLQTSSTSGNTAEYGQGYNADTRGDAAIRFANNKLHPVLKFASDLAFASEKNPVQIGDRALQLFVPLVLQDLYQLSKDDTDMVPGLAASLASYFGMGTQTYDKGEEQAVMVPKSMDYTWQGGILPGMDMMVSHPKKRK